MSPLGRTGSGWLRSVAYALTALLVLFSLKKCWSQENVPRGPTSSRAAGPGLPEGFSVEGVLADLNQAKPKVRSIDAAWWEKFVHQAMRPGASPRGTNVDGLLQLTLENSAQLQVYSEVPLIRETAIIEADAAFDWNAFVDSLWEDKSDPVGSTLTTGNAADRFNDHHLTAAAGVRRRVETGADLEIAQRIGHQDNNSSFFVPPNQGTSRLSVRFTQPLMRGRGVVYNTSLIVLAEIDTNAARDEFRRQLESHLLEVTRAYWGLYLERGTLAQRVKLFTKTRAILRQLERRQHIDAQRTQLISARAAYDERRSELVRAQAAVKNAETRLRTLINADSLGQASYVELIPTEKPTHEYFAIELTDAMQTAIQNRPEVAQAIQELRAASVRLDMARHEMMPVLNAVTEVYVAGLEGRSDVGDAWVQQFSDGAPSYTAGLQFNVPLGRRAASARLGRRRIELRQLEAQYRKVLESIRSEVEIAVREVNTSFEEMLTKQQAMQAATLEAQNIDARWRRLGRAEGSPALVLESLLRAQERVTNTEFSFLSSQLTYNLALMNLKRVMGVLLQMEQVSMGRACQSGVPRTILDKDSTEPIFTGALSERVESIEPLVPPEPVMPIR